MTESQMTRAQNQAQSGADVTRRRQRWYVCRGTGVMPPSKMAWGID